MGRSIDLIGKVFLGRIKRLIPRTTPLYGDNLATGFYVFDGASVDEASRGVRVTPTLASTIAERLPRALASCARDPRARGDVADDVVRRLKWTKEKRSRSSPSQSWEHVC